ncbi:MAG: nucleoside hydrolase [Pseudomonadota bacterium]
MAEAVIFDTDPGIDDAMAIAFAHKSPAVDLLGLTTTFGNGTIEQTTANAVFLKNQLGLDCQVFQGAGAPLEIEFDGPAHHVHGSDALGDTGYDIPAAGNQPDAVTFIIDTVRARPHEVTLVAVGRMTNLALAVRKAPDIAKLVKRVVIMGGVLGSTGIPGNVTPVAEANIFGDPHAADEMMRADWPLVMVGLDVTMKTIMTNDLVERLAQHSQMGALLAEIGAFYQRFYREVLKREGYPVHDSLAVAYLMAPHLFETQAGPIRVATEGLSMGQTIMGDMSRAANYALDGWLDVPDKQACISVQAQAVLDLYMETLMS